MKDVQISPADDLLEFQLLIANENALPPGFTLKKKVHACDDALPVGAYNRKYQLSQIPDDAPYGFNDFL